MKHILETQERFRALRLIMRLARASHASVADRWLNIDTRPCPLERPRGLTRFNNGVRSERAHYFLIAKYIRPLRLTRDNIVIDIGCGAGRLVCVCSGGGASRVSWALRCQGGW